MQRIARAAYFATGKRDGEGEGGVSLHAVVAECAQIVQNAAITAGGISKEEARRNRR